MYVPTKRSRIPPLGRLGLASSRKLTGVEAGCAIRSSFWLLAIVALSEYP